MNDFTKEELQIILEWGQELSSEFGTSGDEEEKALDLKIKSMIDNYCEHESSEPILVLNKKCIKCNCHLETRPWGRK